LTKGRLADKVAELFKTLGIEDELHRTIDDPSAARRRAENIEQIVNAAAGYEERTADPTLAGFLEKVSLAEDDGYRAKRRKSLGMTRLFSCRSIPARGWNFPCLSGWNGGGLLPHDKSISEQLTIDEERRLCYVGITRARKHLTITRCLHRKKYGKLQERQPSRFLEELPDHLLNHQKESPRWRRLKRRRNGWPAISSRKWERCWRGEWCEVVLAACVMGVLTKVVN
jgi:superfamily I DNA/RNA helicase